MTTTRRNHLTSHDRSPFIAERRRKLFAIDDHDLDSELGHMSPICSDTTSESENEGIHSISDYDIMGVVQNNRVAGNETPMSNKACSEIMSPLKLSPAASFRSTPSKYSPSANLKTPHDTSTKPVLQKEQKTLLEESKSLKRKSSLSSSPEHSKLLKIDCKNSKVRTALFPPEDEIFAPLPTKSFYSKNHENVLKKLSAKREEMPSQKHIKFSTVKHRYKSKKFGQINNGVGHKIRRPKQKTMSKAVIAKAAKKMLETAPMLNNYILDLKELTNKQNTDSKLIVKPTNLQENVNITKSIEESMLKNDIHLKNNLQTTKKLISTPVKQIKLNTKENKENVHNDSQYRSASPSSPSSPENTKSRKFFKSSRAKVSSKLEKNKNLDNKFSNDKNDVRKFNLSNDQPIQIASKALLESSNDFEDDYMEPEANIDNILSVLSDDSPQKCVVDQGEVLQQFDSDFQAALTVPNSNFDLMNSLNNVISKSNREHFVGEHGQSLQHYENDCRAAFDMSKSNFHDLNPPNNVVTQNGHGIEGILECGNSSRIFDASQSSSEVKGFEGIQYLHADNNGSDLNVLENSSDRSLEPRIVSSQVVFSELLKEDESHAISTLPNRDGSFSTLPNCIYPPETSKIPNYSSKITLEAHSSVLASENSILLHQSSVANTLLSPISQMCNVTSGLALNSPKRGRNLSGLLNNMSRASKILSFTNSHSADMEQQPQKLFPVFYPGARAAPPERGEKRERGEVKRSAKKFKALHEDQMLLDAGQKKFGYTICNECNIVYHMGDPGDEIEHTNYHNASHILRFAGWKNEHLVADFQKSGRIIRVLPSDSKIWLKKVKDLMEFVKRDLGCYEMEYDITGAQVYLYIKNRTIAGCAVATVPKEGGHRMLSSLSGVALCSEESYPIKCGISHIWVAANFRKQGIATALLDAVRNNFIYGHILADNDVALTSPTEAGSAFAEKYFKTPNYLVYYA